MNSNVTDYHISKTLTLHDKRAGFSFVRKKYLNFCSGIEIRILEFLNRYASQNVKYLTFGQCMGQNVKYLTFDTPELPTP